LEYPVHLILAILNPLPSGVLPSIVEAALNRGWRVSQVGLNSVSDRVAHYPASTQLELGTQLLELQLRGCLLLACCSDAALAADALKAKQPHLTCAGLVEYSKTAAIGEILDRTYDKILAHRWTVGAALQPECSRFLVITGERGLKPVKTIGGFAHELLEVLASRSNVRHHRTLLEVIPAFPGTIAAQVEEVLTTVRQWAQWALFPRYQSTGEVFAEAEFGFIARRTPAGTLITARGSNKEMPSPEDLALVQSITQDGTLIVKSPKRKASLNAPLAHQIFALRPDVHWILHAHVFLQEGVTVAATTTPGTEGDWAAIEAAVRAGATIINQPLHGTLVLLQAPQDLLPLLMRNGLYQQQSQLYEQAYARFQGSADKQTHFEMSVAQLLLARDTPVLDVCCGTGASTLVLEKLGFANVAFCDGSASMLAVAQAQLGRSGSLVSLEDPQPPWALGHYGLITLRQAFNYLPSQELAGFFERMHRCLIPGGYLVFNTFGTLKAGALAPRDFEQETGASLVRTREHNEVTPADVLHSQRSEILDFDAESWNAVLDVNRFFQHAMAEVTGHLHHAGFSAQLLKQGASLLIIARRSTGSAESP
jgi:prepilin-type processing-associated H-X9-DG protein